MRVTFIGSSVVEPSGERPSEEQTTYFRTDGGLLHAFHPLTYGSVVYRDLYPSIDLRYLVTDDDVKYEFIIHPGGDPSLIRMSYDGVGSLSIDPDGALVFEGTNTRFRDGGLEIFQEIQGVRVGVPGSFCIDDDGTVRFVLGGHYDPSEVLVIDPVLSFGTYIGGSEYDEVMDMTMDEDDNIYLTGLTWSPSFPTSDGAFQRSLAGYWDIFVMKLNPSGDRVLFSTFIGTTTWEEGVGIDVDTDDNVFLTGSTRDIDFPTTPGAYDTLYNGRRDVFVLKLSPDGSRMIYSTFVGGSWFDYGGDVAVDGTGRAIVTGWTFSDDFPTTAGAVGSSYMGNGDAFLLVLTAMGDGLAYSTYLGGEKEDAGLEVLVTDDGDAVLAGSTSSPGFPTTDDALRVDNGGSEDGFVARFDLSAPVSMTYCTFLGGSGSDRVTGLAQAIDGDIVVGGTTGSSDYPTSASAHSRSLSGGTDAFITTLDPTDWTMEGSTLLGGSDNEVLHDIAVDGTGCILVTGSTGSGNYPAQNWTFQPSLAGGLDAFLSRLTSDGGRILYSTLLGGTNDDTAVEMDLDAIDIVVVSGNSNSSDLPTTSGSLSRAYMGEGDGFVVKLDVIPPTFRVDSTPGAISTGTTLTFSIQVTDNAIVREVWAEYLVDPDQGLRIDMDPIDGGHEYSGTLQIPSSARGLTYRFHALDTSGNWNVTGWRSVSVDDLVGPDQMDDLTPSNGTTGDPFTFRAIVSDNIGVASVHVEYWFSGNSSRRNLSLVGVNEFKAGIVLPRDSVASMQYFISASDLNGNWVTSPTRTVIVRDDDPPEMISDLSDEEGTTGDPVTLMEHVMDNIRVQEVWATYWFPMSDRTSVKMEYLDDYWTSASVPPDGSPRMYYYFEATDTAGNVNRTPILSLTVEDDDPPFMTDDLSDGTACTGNIMHFIADITDNVALASVDVEFWYDDQTEPTTNPMAASGHYRSDTVVPSSGVDELHYRFIARDGNGNRLETEEVTLDISDDDPPSLLSDNSAVEAFTGDPFTFDIQVSDNRDVPSVDVIYQVGVHEPVSRTMDGSELTVLIPPDEEGRLRYHFEISDSTGNLNTTAVVSVGIHDNDAPNATLEHRSSVLVGETITLDGTRSSDNVGVVTWTWTITGEGEEYVLLGPEAAIVFDREGTYSIDLTVRDGSGNTDANSSSITVREKGTSFYQDPAVVWILVVVVAIVIASAAWNYLKRQGDDRQ